jgi:hypothetical protein
VMSLLIIPAVIFNPSILVYSPLILLFLVGTWMVSVRYEVSDNGIRKIQILKGGKIAWQEIASIKSNVMQRNFELRDKNKRVLKISTQVKGYPQIVEILRQKRPDLFGMAAPPAKAFAGDRSPQPPYRFDSYNSSVPVTPPFTGNHVFKKSFIKRYGSIILGLIVLPFGIPTFWANSTQNLIIELIVIATALYLIAAPLFEIQEVEVTPGMLTISGVFNANEFNPNQIANITMQTARSRRGTATHYIVVKPVDGKAISMSGFKGGEESVYSILQNWWQSGRR